MTPNRPARKTRTVIELTGFTSIANKELRELIVSQLLQPSYISRVSFEAYPNDFGPRGELVSSIRILCPKAKLILSVEVDNRLDFSHGFTVSELTNCCAMMISTSNRVGKAIDHCRGCDKEIVTNSELARNGVFFGFKTEGNELKSMEDIDKELDQELSMRLSNEMDVLDSYLIAADIRTIISSAFEYHNKATKAKKTTM